MNKINNNKLISLSIIFVFSLLLAIPHAFADNYTMNGGDSSMGTNVSYSYTPNQNYNNYAQPVYVQQAPVYSNPNPYYYYTNNNAPVATSQTSSTQKTNSSTTKTTKDTTTTATTADKTALSDTGAKYNNMLGANALFASNGFMPNNFFQWLIFFIIILAIVFLWRKLYVTEQEKRVPLKHA